MSTLNELVNELILEQKEASLHLYYNIDVYIQEFKDGTPEEGEVTAEPEIVAAPVEEPVAPVAAAPAEEPIPTQESENFKGTLLTEAILKRKLEGELVVPRKDAMNIQTIQDLIDYLTDKKHTSTTIVEKVLEKKGSVAGENILSPEIQEIILLLAGAGGTGNLGDIVNKGDKVIIDLDYGNSKLSSIGFKINKNAGTDVFSIMIKKDGKILSGKFDQAIINKQILFFRNSLETV